MASQGADMGAGSISSAPPASLTRELNRSMTLPVGNAEDELLLDEAAAVCDAELQGTRVALRNRAQDASKKLLQLMHETRDSLRFWEEKLQSPASLERVLVLQTGARMFFKCVYPVVDIACSAIIAQHQLQLPVSLQLSTHV